MSATAGTALVAALLVAVACLVLPGSPHPARPGGARGAGAGRAPGPAAAGGLAGGAAGGGGGAPPPAAVDAVARVLREAGSPVAEHLAGLGTAPPGLPEPPGGRGYPTRGVEDTVASLRGPLARCLELAEQTGAPVAVLLRSAADELRRRRRRAAALAAARLGVRVVAPLGLCTLPAFAALAVVPVLISLGRDLLAG